MVKVALDSHGGDGGVGYVAAVVSSGHMIVVVVGWQLRQ